MFFEAHGLVVPKNPKTLKNDWKLKNFDSKKKSKKIFSGKFSKFPSFGESPKWHHLVKVQNFENFENLENFPENIFRKIFFEIEKNVFRYFVKRNSDLGCINQVPTTYTNIWHFLGTETNWHVTKDIGPSDFCLLTNGTCRCRQHTLDPSGK